MSLFDLDVTGWDGWMDGCKGGEKAFFNSENMKRDGEGWGVGVVEI